MIMFHVNLQGGMFYQLSQKKLRLAETERFIPTVVCIVVAVACVFVHQKWHRNYTASSVAYYVSIPKRNETSQASNHVKVGAKHLLKLVKHYTQFNKTFRCFVSCT